MPTRATGRLRRRVTSSLIVEPLEGRWLLNTGPMTSPFAGTGGPSPDGAGADSFGTRSGENRPAFSQWAPSHSGTYHGFSSGGAQPDGPPFARPDTFQRSGPGPEPGAVVVVILPAAVARQTESATSDSGRSSPTITVSPAGAEKSLPTQPAALDTRLAAAPGVGSQTTPFDAYLPPDYGKIDGRASTLTAALPPAALAPVGNENATGISPARDGIGEATSPSLLEELDFPPALANPDRGDAHLDAYFSPQTANLFVGNVAQSVRAMDQAVREFLEPLRDGPGRLTVSLYWLGGTSWLLAAALACEGARRYLARRPGLDPALTITNSDPFPEADL
jgi:hypothetical protein